MPLAVQYGMPLDEFWHGDMRLLQVYQKAYLRDKSYTAWLNGNFVMVAHGLALSNAFKKQGEQDKQYPEWEDPIEKLSKPKITKENREIEARKEQQRQNAWFSNILHKK